ncbi:hypothetical protein K443DRAFT_624137 [Laccaria amethystina LaAM-08-1]|uniref:Ricin B lectin domain-containing protein n=1 Tax=Laccaria amethystina LaAM-08-1 TaxID=1095629 RepID=A0A0C9X384_9AGAR|nr:hypothetical protein K443DRAFT_624137 [Laccaria amethystina LaAM-08-1]
MPLITGTTYRITNIATQNVLESGAQHTADLRPWDNRDAQKWVATIEPGTQNSWFLRNVGTGRSLGVAGNILAHLVLETETNAENLARFDNARIVGLNAQANQGFKVEVGGFVTVTDVSNPAGNFYTAGQIIQLFFDSDTETRVWNFEEV